MKETLAYYAELTHGFYTRSVRKLKWRHDYYILPAYQSLFEPYTTRDRMAHLRDRFLEYTDNLRTRHPLELLRDKYLVGGAAALVVLLLGVALTSGPSPDSGADSSAATSSRQAAPSTATTPAPLSAAAPPQAQPAPAPEQAPILFGLGAQAEGALKERIVSETNVRMLTSWFNSPSDLEFMKPWARDIIPQTYAEGYSHHVIVWTGGEEQQFTSRYGQACGRTYPFSQTFAADMEQLARTFNGSGTLYVSMFTEFQTYPCQDNIWNGNENYYRALKDQYRLAMDIFHTHAPNSKVSLTWGGWQAAWDDRGQGGGRSLIPHFADVMNKSDFQSFQAMDSVGDNPRHIADMTRILHGYGNGRVMVAHFKPDNGSQSAWRRDMNGIFTPPMMQQLRKDGLFAFSFMDEKNMNASLTDYQLARQAVGSYSK